MTAKSPDATPDVKAVDQPDVELDWRGRERGKRTGQQPQARAAGGIKTDRGGRPVVDKGGRPVAKD